MKVAARGPLPLRARLRRRAGAGDRQERAFQASEISPYRRDFFGGSVRGIGRMRSFTGAAPTWRPAASGSRKRLTGFRAPKGTDGPRMRAW